MKLYIVNKMEESEFNQKYKTISNHADGNCLFESISYLLNNQILPNIIREKVFLFYTEFDREINYPQNTIENAIKTSLEFDREDDNGMIHELNIRNDKVWANMTDLLVCSIVLDVDINLHIQYDKNIILEIIKYQYQNEKTIDILYNGTNHFEALIPITVDDYVLEDFNIDDYVVFKK